MGGDFPRLRPGGASLFPFEGAAHGAGYHDGGVDLYHAAGESEGEPVAGHPRLIEHEKGRHAKENRAPGLDARQAFDSHDAACVGGEQPGDEQRGRPRGVDISVGGALQEVENWHERSCHDEKQPEGDGYDGRQRGLTAGDFGRSISMF